MPQPLDSFAFNIFDSSIVSAASTDGWVYFVNNVNPTAVPQSTAVQRKYRVTSQPVTAKDASNAGLKQIAFSPHTRNILLFVLSREVMVFNTVMHQSIASIGLDLSRPAFSHVFFIRSHPQILCCFHEDGALSVWKRYAV